MFDNLIETETAGNEFKSRTRYFLVSTVAVGILFLSAVLISIFAAEYGIGMSEFDSARFLAPVTVDKPEPVEEQAPSTAPNKQAALPTRNSNMARVDEVQSVPTSVSVTQNTNKARPLGRYDIKSGPETDGIGKYQQNGTPNGSKIGTSSFNDKSSSDTNEIPIKPVPPIKRPERPKAPISLGPLNGKASSLPKPPYPQAALKMNIQGIVTVQVLIDEKGNVVSAKASSGHPLLKDAAERAAMNAKFSPTLLSNVPVKVTGVIRYNFTR